MRQNTHEAHNKVYHTEDDLEHLIHRVVENGHLLAHALVTFSRDFGSPSFLVFAVSMYVRAAAHGVAVYRLQLKLLTLAHRCDCLVVATLTLIGNDHRLVRWARCWPLIQSIWVLLYILQGRDL